MVKVELRLHWLTAVEHWKASNLLRMPRLLLQTGKSFSLNDPRYALFLHRKIYDLRIIF
jgi:hypothetical protein